ncbi:MAG: tetratricopeptide repeat protein [Bacillus sp. (in: Bacteria)]|nr:tetratricopeptide repeat protein [Bacillus sp. (in: firmicutes)]
MRKDSHVEKNKGKILSFIPTGEYYFSKGVKAFQRGDLENAKKYLIRANQLEPLEPMIVCQLGIVYAETGEYQKSNQLFHQVLNELDPYMVECHYFLANNYAYLGLFKESYKHITTYLELDPNGEFVQDAEELLEIIQLDAEEANEVLYEQDELIVKQEQAREQLEAGNFSKAIQMLEDIIEQFPDFYSAYNNLALAYFYTGETEKATTILHTVLDKNPGNLHALCNAAVFMYYQREEGRLNQLLDRLEKTYPMLLEHRYKLGATMALVGRYEKAFYWLRKLQKQGFEGDPAFYYWLSQAAYHTNHLEIARAAWKKLEMLSPEKKGTPPWEQKNTEPSLEINEAYIMEKMASTDVEDRLFGIFLFSLSENKKRLLSHTEWKGTEQFTSLEKGYFSLVLSEYIEAEVPAIIQRGHDVAVQLYEKHRPIRPENGGLFAFWFVVFTTIASENATFANVRGMAAGIDYLWHHLRNEKVTQRHVAELYGVSPSTVAKYVKQLKEWILK